MKRYALILLSAITFASCAGNTEKADTPASDSAKHADSLRQHEEDEMAEEVIRGSFEALNR